MAKINLNELSTQRLIALRYKYNSELVHDTESGNWQNFNRRQIEKIDKILEERENTKNEKD